MKNFIQFMIPMIIICGIGLGMMYFSDTDDSDHKLYIKCEGKLSKSYGVHSGMTMIEYQPKHETCSLEIEVLDVTLEYIKFNSANRKLVAQKANEELDTEQVNTVLVAANEEKVMISVDNKTKFSFVYK